MRRMLGRRVVERHVLDRVGGADDLGWAVLPLRRPHRQARQEPAVWLLELAQGVGDVASVLSLMSLSMHIYENEDFLFFFGCRGLRRKVLKRFDNGVLGFICHVAELPRLYSND